MDFCFESAPGIHQPSTINYQHSQLVVTHKPKLFPLLETRSNRIFTMQKHPFIKQTRTLIRGLQ
jgi:hypothetical protein